jgi:hypothetical protein
MVILDAVDGLKVYGLNDGVPPCNDLHLEGWLETLYDFLENIVYNDRFMFILWSDKLPRM